MEAQKSFPNGSQVNVSVRIPGELIGPAAVFSKSQRYPCDIVALEPTTLMVFQKEDLISLMQKDVQILQNFTTEIASATYIVPDKKASEIDETDDYIAENLIGDSGFVNDTIRKDAAMKVNAGETLIDRVLALESTFHSTAGLDYDALAVTISEKLDTDGNITLTIYNAKNAKGEDSTVGDRYTLILPFGVDRSESTNTKTENVSSTAVSDTEYTVVTKTTKTDHNADVAADRN